MPNNAAVATSENLKPEAPLRRELRRRLLSLPYRAFLQVAVHLLKEQGYTAARPTGRNQWKGRNTAGGWDAEADFQAGALGTLRCIAQVKQFDTLVVAQRHVDELRGTCLRANAHQAVLITLSTFSPPARKAAQANTSIAPVRLIDGDELLDMLVDTKLCLRRSRSGAWTLDEDYFAAIKESIAVRKTPEAREDVQCQSAREPRSRPQALCVTIRLDPPDGFPRTGAWQWEADISGPPDVSEVPQ